MPVVDLSVTIERPLADVYAVLSDPTRTPRWSKPAVKEWVSTPGPIRVGSRRRAITAMGPMRTENEAEVTELEPERRIALRSVVAPISFRVAMDFAEPAPGRTRVDWRWEFFPRGVLRLGNPLIGPFWRRSFARDLGELKRQMEAGEL
jgi:uncharacterized protein YndB with AHSA1/START domain